MSVYEKILFELLKESKAEKNLDNIPDPNNISKGLVIELIKSADGKSAVGLRYTVEKVFKDASGKHMVTISRPGYQQDITFKELTKKYKRA
jgi:hypothetical protein